MRPRLSVLAAWLLLCLSLTVVRAAPHSSPDSPSRSEPSPMSSPGPVPSLTPRHVTIPTLPVERKSYMRAVTIQFLSVHKRSLSTRKLSARNGASFPAQNVIAAIFQAAKEEFRLESDAQGQGKLPRFTYYPVDKFRRWNPQQVLKLEITRDAAKHGEGTCNDNCYATATPVPGKNGHYNFEIELDEKGEDGKLKVISKKEVEVGSGVEVQ